MDSSFSGPGNRSFISSATFAAENEPLLLPFWGNEAGVRLGRAVNSLFLPFVPVLSGNRLKRLQALALKTGVDRLQRRAGERLELARSFIHLLLKRGRALDLRLRRTSTVPVDSAVQLAQSLPQLLLTGNHATLFHRDKGRAKILKLLDKPTELIFHPGVGGTCRALMCLVSQIVDRIHNEGQLPEHVIELRHSLVL